MAADIETPTDEAYWDSEDEILRACAPPTKHFPACCLCGSTRLADWFWEAGWQLTIRGWVILTISFVKHAEHHGGEQLGVESCARLDAVHYAKIDMADVVFVLNVGCYIGESTAREIEYARHRGKPVVFLETEEPSSE